MGIISAKVHGLEEQMQQLGEKCTSREGWRAQDQPAGASGAGGSGEQSEGSCGSRHRRSATLIQPPTTSHGLTNTDLDEQLTLGEAPSLIKRSQPMEIDDNQRQRQSARVSPGGFPGIHHSYGGGERLPHSCRAPRGSHGLGRWAGGKEGGLLEMTAVRPNGLMSELLTGFIF